MDTRNTDYLIVGAGAMGMAFADVILAESTATITIVDRYHQPGGHWNVAYPFVKLHQPSSFYGVNSRPLGNDRIDTTGSNKGLYELAGKSEIGAYYEALMQQYISSGRVQYFPMCEYQGDGNIKSLVSGDVHQVQANITVDATFMNVRVPAMSNPSYDVDDAVTCVAPNALVELRGNWHHYMIIGAGKTSMDTCLYLLDNGVSPNNISWIKPRESWLWDRACAQSNTLFETSIRPFALDQMKTIAESESLEDLFVSASAKGLFLRIDEQVEPTMFRCATVTQSEVEQLRTIEQVIRLGRVKCIEHRKVTLDQGIIETPDNTLYVDCTADGLARRPPQPVFADNHITLQAIRTCQQVFSAAFIAHIQVNKQDQARKNTLCAPVPHPDSHLDYLRCTLADLVNAATWAEDESLAAWMKSARLDGFTHPASSAESDADFLAAMAANGAAAAEKLMGYLAEVEGDSL